MYYDGFDASLYLEHYGVKGMKWGIKKAKKVDVSSTGGGGGGEEDSNDGKLIEKTLNIQKVYSRSEGQPMFNDDGTPRKLKSTARISDIPRSVVKSGAAFLSKVFNVQSRTYESPKSRLYDSNTGKPRSSKDIKRDLKNKRKIFRRV